MNINCEQIKMQDVIDQINEILKKHRRRMKVVHVEDIHGCLRAITNRGSVLLIPYIEGDELNTIKILSILRRTNSRMACWAQDGWPDYGTSKILYFGKQNTPIVKVTRE